MFKNITDFLVPMMKNLKKFHCNLLIEILFFDLFLFPCISQIQNWPLFYPVFSIKGNVLGV